MPVLVLVISLLQVVRHRATARDPDRDRRELQEASTIALFKIFKLVSKTGTTENTALFGRWMMVSEVQLSLVAISALAKYSTSHFKPIAVNLITCSISSIVS